MKHIFPRLILQPSAFRLPLSALVLVAFGLYVWQLDAQPLWWDEGGSVHATLFAPLDLLHFTATTEDHPPGYYLILKSWFTVAGPSPFSARLLSVFCGTLLIPLLYTTGRRLRGKWTGVAAALLGGAMPFVVQHVREARMYGLAMLLVAASTYALLRLLSGAPASRRWWAVYLGSVIAGLYTHYAFALLLLPQAAAVLVAWTQKHVSITRPPFVPPSLPYGIGHAPAWEDNDGGTRLRPWWLAALIGLAAYLPWCLYTLPRLQNLLTGHLGGETHGLNINPGMLLPSFSLLVLGTESVAIAGILILSGLALLAGLGALALIRRQRAMTLYLILGSGLSFLLVVLLQRSVSQTTLISIAARQIFFSVPLWILLIASGLAKLSVQRRWLGGVLLLGTVSVLAVHLPPLYQPPVDTSEDYRPLVAQVRALARPGDAALTAYFWQDGYFASYAPDLALAFYRNNANAQTAAPLLQNIFSAHPRLWIINYRATVHYRSDPLNIWLMRNAARAYDAGYGNSQIALFVRPGGPPADWPAQAVFQNNIALDYVPLQVTAHPGDVIPLDLRWRTAQPLDVAYTVFIHLRLPDAPPIAQADGQPLDELEPTTQWQPGQPVIDRRAILIPPDAPAGKYPVLVGLYDGATQMRLNLAAPAGCDLPDGVCLGYVEIVQR